VAAVCPKLKEGRERDKGAKGMSKDANRRRVITSKKFSLLNFLYIRMLFGGNECLNRSLELLLASSFITPATSLYNPTFVSTKYIKF
jgi:hypothetical protein